jgi:hypothetical protein
MSATVISDALQAQRNRCQHGSTDQFMTQLAKQPLKIR